MDYRRKDSGYEDDPGPFYYANHTIGVHKLDLNKRVHSTATLRLNSLELYDNYGRIGLDIEAYRYWFFDHEQTHQTDKITFSTDGAKRQPNVMLIEKFSMSDIGLKHTRRVFNMWLFLAYVGGLTYSLHSIIGWSVEPFAKHGFVLRALKRLYVARTQDQFAFKQNAQDGTRFQRHFEDLDVQNNSMFEGGQSRSKNRDRRGSYKEEDALQSARSSQGLRNHRNEEHTPGAQDWNEKNQKHSQQKTKGQDGPLPVNLTDLYYLSVPDLAKEIQTHKVVRVSCNKYCYLFCCNFGYLSVSCFMCRGLKWLLNCCGKCCCKTKKQPRNTTQRFQKFIERGKKRLRNEMDVFNIVRKIRYGNIIDNATFLRTEYRKYLV